MKELPILSILLFLSWPSAAADFFFSAPAEIRASETELPLPGTAPEAVPGAEAKASAGGELSCEGNVCTIITPRTNVCSDGRRISTERISDPKSPDNGKYKDGDLRAWAEHQKKLGRSQVWSDGSHQNITATGIVNPFTTAYVVVPIKKRWLLHKDVKVCVLDTGDCIMAKVLELGPAFGEVSVGALMRLGLDAHPDLGRYEGRVSYTFYK